jgi:hypothetical protein
MTVDITAHHKLDVAPATGSVHTSYTLAPVVLLVADSDTLAYTKAQTIGGKLTHTPTASLDCHKLYPVHIDYLEHDNLTLSATRRQR